MIRALALGAIAACALPVPAAADTPASAAMAATEEPDPARIALAEPLALILWPDGTYRRSMERTMRVSVQAGVDASLSTVEQFLTKDSKEARQMRSSSSSAQQQRASVQAEAESAMAAMIPIFERAEPALRRGLARALARRFDTRELQDLAAFFATSTGSRYAAESMNLMTDPDVLAATMSVMPEIVAASVDRARAAIGAEEE